MDKLTTTGEQRALIRELQRQEELVEYYKDTVFQGDVRAAKRRAAKARKKYEEQVAKITASRVGRR